MKPFTVMADEKIFDAMDYLRQELGKTSRAEVFRMAIALLKIAGEARRDGLKLTVSDNNNKVLREIVLPS
jgi:hypothetical protein